MGVSNLGERLILAAAILCIFVFVTVYLSHSIFPDTKLYGAEKAEASEMSIEEKFNAVLGIEEEISSDESGKIDVNTATVDDLLTIPGIGRNIAENIYEYRLYNGRFSDVDELIYVTGMGSKTFESIRSYLTVN